MPHTDTLGTETPADIAGTMDTAAAQRVEQEKLTRRAALRKLGFGAGIAAFSLLGVDDFARMVGKRLQRNAHDNKTAMAVAKEFQSAGIALAAPSGDNLTLPQNCVNNQTADNTDCCDGSNMGDWCYGRYTTTAERVTCCNGTYRNLCRRYVGGAGGNRSTCLAAANA